MKIQRNTYDYQVMRSLKRKYHLILLRGGKCQKCGYDKNLAAFDFHHRDPKTKKFKMIKEQKIGDYYCKYFPKVKEGEYIQAVRKDNPKSIINYPSHIGTTKHLKPTAKFRVKWKQVTS